MSSYDSTRIESPQAATSLAKHFDVSDSAIRKAQRDGTLLAGRYIINRRTMSDEERECQPSAHANMEFLYWAVDTIEECEQVEGVELRDISTPQTGQDLADKLNVSYGMINQYSRAGDVVGGQYVIHRIEVDAQDRADYGLSAQTTYAYWAEPVWLPTVWGDLEAQIVERTRQSVENHFREQFAQADPPAHEKREGGKLADVLLDLAHSYEVSMRPAPADGIIQVTLSTFDGADQVVGYVEREDEYVDTLRTLERVLRGQDEQRARVKKQD